MQDFRELRVWHESRRMTVAVYDAVRPWPRYELFGLTSQVRRSVAAIGSAIVEGFGKATRLDCARCLQTAISEAGETYHHFFTALDLGYLTQAQFSELEAQIQALRARLAALYFRIRPAGKGRRERWDRRTNPPRSGGKSAPQARRIQRRSRGNSAP